MRRNKRGLVWFILFVCCCVPFLCYSTLAPRTFSVSLSSGWSSSPMELQFSEWIAQRGPSHFWQFVQDLFQLESLLESDQDSFDWCEKWIASRWDVASGQVAVWSVVAVEQLGSVLLQNQWSSHVWYSHLSSGGNNLLSQEKPRVFAEYRDRLYTHWETLIADLQHNHHHHHNVTCSHCNHLDIQAGHMYPPNCVNRESIPLVILYGHIGKMEMKPWHDALFSMANDGNLCYIIRHSYESNSSNRSMYLQGYGVEVFVKNTEYLVEDPLAYPCSSHSQEEEERNHWKAEWDISTISDKRCWLQGDCFLGGIENSSLWKDYYSLSSQELSSLQMSLYDWQQSFHKDLKPWEVSDIGLSATRAIVRSRDPLSMLERIANNLPLYAPLLAGPWHISEAEAYDYRQHLQYVDKEITQSTCMLWLNGRPLSCASSSWGVVGPTLFRCMDAITLARNIKEWSDYGLEDRNDTRWWNTLSPSKQPCIRLSLVDPSPVVYIQNEDDISFFIKDTKASMSFSDVFYEYASYLRANWDQRISASQLIDVIFVMDPLDRDHFVVVQWMKQVLEQGWPIRVGIALIPSDDNNNETSSSSSSSRRSMESIDWDAYTQSSNHEQDAIWYHLASDKYHFPKTSKTHRLQQQQKPEQEEESMAEMILFVLHYLTTQVPCPISGYYFLAKLKQEWMPPPRDIFSLLSAASGDGWNPSQEEEEKTLQWDHIQRAFLFAYPFGFSCTPSQPQQPSPQALWQQWIAASKSQPRCKRHRQWANAMGFSRLPTVIVHGVVLTDVPTQLVATLEQAMKSILQPSIACTATRWIPRHNTRLQQAMMPAFHPSTLKEILQHDEYRLAINYFTTLASPCREEMTRATIWLVVDVESLQGWKLMALAVEWLLSPRSSVAGRVAFLSPHRCSHLALHPQQPQPQIESIKQRIIAKMQQRWKNIRDYHDFISYVPGILADHLHRDTTNNRIWINGFEYSPELFTFFTDFDLACARMCPSSPSRGNGEMDADQQLLWSFTVHWLDYTCCSSSSSLSLLVYDWKQVLGENFDDALFAFHSSSSSSHPVFHVKAILDPLSPHTAKAATLLATLREYFDVSLSVLLLPDSYTLMQTIQQASFYRTVLAPRPHFEAGALVTKPSAVFTTLWSNRTFTVSMDTPPKWLIGASHAQRDLDNLVLQPNDWVHAEYELEAILVEGICIDVSNPSSFVPPQGLSLGLLPWTTSDHHPQDTLVMANLGYFQLQTNIGVWQLKIGQRQGIPYQLVKMDEHTRLGDTMTSIFSDALSSGTEVSSSCITTMKKKHPTWEMHHNDDSHPPSVDDLMILLQTLQGKTLILYVATTSSNHHQSSSGALLPRWLSSWWFSLLSSAPKKRQPSDNPPEKLHVFSLASGYLYERLIRIMMLSVVQHSSVPVQFWLLRNYLSPNFKKMLPHFASTCGFEYQLVTYQWPSWLTPQTEKQRIMWAYKILFLDVLFPGNVSKVVFVDSDQVVRADLYELFQLPLSPGAPYGYVPFCDSRKSVQGYRFWKQGFWAELLKDQKYRISALYVVDLNRFRKMAAGDSLRAIYQRLVQDPSSLSNLDQDLPNFASVPQPGLPHVPIHDLPPEWLWCETWCDDESKKYAKTIDLCNNPMTKERKLDAAKRIIPEWTELDKKATDIVVQALSCANTTTTASRHTKTTNKTSVSSSVVLHEEL